MNMNKYQVEAQTTAVYLNPYYPMMAIGEEVGELQGIFAKAMRKGLPYDRDKAVDELGDVLWNCAMIAYEMNINLAEVAELNLEKLRERKQSNTLDTMERKHEHT